MKPEELAETLASIKVTQKQAEAIKELTDIIGRYQDQLHEAEELLMKTLNSTFVPYKDIVKYFENVRNLWEN